MKRFILIVIGVAFIGLTTVFLACNKSSKENITQTSKVDRIKDHVFLSTTTDTLSVNVFKLGVKAIKLISQSASSLTFKLEATPINNFNDIENYSLDNRVVIFNVLDKKLDMIFEDGEKITFDSLTNEYIFSKDGISLNLNNPNFESLYNDFTTETQNNFYWGVYIFNEIIDRDLIREPQSLQRLPAGHYTAIQFGHGRNSLTTVCNNWINGFLKDNPNCVSLGLDISCI